MRILLFHNRYLQKGGEDSVVDAEATLLRRRGHNVQTRFVLNEGMETAFGSAAGAVLASANPQAARWVSETVAEFRPDVVHIHNFFPRLSPSAHRAAARQRVAVVQTLHNFRLLCAAATFFRDGRPCEKCLGRVGLPAVRYGCYRGSRPGSAAVVGMQLVSRMRGVWQNDVDRFIALTNFSKRKFVEGGLPEGRIVVKPNFLDAPTLVAQPRHGALYVGRLSREKGVDVLVDAWHRQAHIPLTIIGGGPLEQELRAAAPPNVHFAGALASAEVTDAMCRAALLIVPSLWYEGFPMVLVEAGAMGLPVLASRIGSLAEVVEEGVSGHLFAPGSAAELADEAARLLADPVRLEALSHSARQRFIERYSADVNGAAIEAIYEDAIANAEATRGMPAWKERC